MSSSAITGPILSDVRRSPSGSAAAPSWSFADATGTGVYLASTDVLALSTAGVQRVVVDAGGNVGIGGAPNDWGSNYKALEVGNDSGNGWMTGASGYSQSFFTANSYFNGTAWILKHTGQAKRFVMDPANNSFIFSSASGTAGQTITWNEKMRIHGNGRVQVNTGASGVTFAVNTSLAGTLSFCNGSGATAVPTVLGISDNNEGLGLASATNNTNTNGDMSFGIREIDNSDFSTTTSNGFIWRRFSTTLGTCTRAGVWSKAGGGSWAVLSDERLKHSIQDLGPGLPMITALRPVSFEWKDENVNPLQSKKGFIAQEVEKVNPNWVQESAREEITVDGKVEEILNVKQVQFDTEFTAVLVKAIQEQQAQIEALKAEVAALKAP